MFFSEFFYTGAVDQFSVSCNELQFFITSFPFGEVELNEEASTVSIYVAGFAARNMKAKVYCKCCLLLLMENSKECFEISVNKDISGYFKNLNRGGLTYPSDKLIYVLSKLLLFFPCAFWCQ